MRSKRISSKICQHHLERKAVLYLGQSSDRQVQENLESQRLQYGLADWARDMGWPNVEVIDADLGVSASVGAPDRDGFDRLIELVSQGNVGVILSREASRLARTDKDWCRVLEVCPLFDTLIGDGQQVYDLNLMDDQLVNQRLMSNNSLNIEGDEAVRAVRSGQGLLVGLLRCGRCGRKFHIRYSGRKGTAGRYCCKGDYANGGRYCLAFGNATVDKRFGAELLKIISPLGAKASLEALDWLCCENEDQQQAFASQLEQAEYEAMRAFEQYDQVDPRNRLVAADLEERWNRKLEEVNSLKQALERVQETRPLLSAAQRQRVVALGERFAHVWNHGDCSVELKKKIVRSVVEEIVVDEGESQEDLRLIVHWKGGVHTQFEMPRALVPRGGKTAADDVEVIRKMAAGYGDDEIARVLNKLGRRTGMGKRWSMQRVARVRRQHSIAGRSRTQPDPEVLTQHTAAKYCGVSQTTIKRLVAADILPMTQVVPWAPWEIRRSDLDSKVIRDIVEHLRKTGKLVLSQGTSDAQRSLFPEEMA